MGVENEIRKLLMQGITPQQAVQRGYKKSTVYKVYNSLTTAPIPLSEPVWFAEGITYNKERFLPGDVVDVKYYLKNGSGVDLYVYRTGVQPEWVYRENIWYSEELRALLEPGQSKQVGISFCIPDNLALGEYELRFGLEGQFLYTSLDYSRGINYTQWSTPDIIPIQYAIVSQVFISHSVQDISLIRQLQQHLDNYGIYAVIAEDIPEPGSVLEEKFFRMIKDSDYFLAFLTNYAVNSDWVMREINYADQISKPMILMKEESVNIQSTIEWVKFSQYEPIDEIMANVVDSIQKTWVTTKGSRSSAATHALIAGVFGFLAGLIAAGAKKEQTS